MADPATPTLFDPPELPNPVQSSVDLHLMELSAIRQSLVENKGNVLAVVTFPKNERSKPRACDGQTWEEDLRIRMSYDKLMCLGSSKITSMFRPKAQERFRRRLNLGMLPPGIDYVLDFTPPAEGPELADLTAMLWLPRICKLWFLAGHYVPHEILATGGGVPHRPMADKAVGCVLSLGHDDVCKADNCEYLGFKSVIMRRITVNRTITGLKDLCEWATKDSVRGIFDENPLNYDTYLPPFRKVPDYCPIRHRVAIMRVLRAINGHGLLINSAVRMWTVAQVAIYLEVPEVVVDPITQWLTAPPNTKFVEICPEKAFQLAYALRIPTVLIASFKILVNDAAIDYAATDPSPRLPSKTWVQRRRDDYGDFPSDPVDYGSRAFLERINSQLQMFQSDMVFDLLQPRTSEWDKLQKVASVFETLKDPHPLKDAYRKLVESLAHTFRTGIDAAFKVKTSLFHRQLLTEQRSHYLSVQEFTDIDDIYDKLNDTQKALTPIFWRALRNIDWNSQCENASFEGYGPRHYIAAFNSELYRAIVDKEIPDPRNIFPAMGSHCGFFQGEFFDSVYNCVQGLCGRILYRDNDRNFPYFLSDHLLLSLEDSELKYLPIWADGLDDGSGGVFQEAIPPAEMGPSEPGPAYHTGYTIASSTNRGGDTEIGDYASTIAPSDFGMNGLDLDDATVARSVSAQQSVSAVTDGPGPNTTRVVAAPSEIASEQFTDDNDDDNDYAEAAFAQPAEHQAQGQALARYVEDVSSSSASSTTDFSDLGDFDAADHQQGEEDMMEFSDDDGTSTLDGYEELDPWSAEI